MLLVCQYGPVSVGIIVDHGIIVRLVLLESVRQGEKERESGWVIYLFFSHKLPTYIKNCVLDPKTSLRENVGGAYLFT